MVAQEEPSMEKEGQGAGKDSTQSHGQCSIIWLFGESQGAKDCLQMRAVRRKQAMMSTMASPRYT